MIQFGNYSVLDMADSGFFGLNGFGLPSEWPAIYLTKKLKRAQHAAASKTTTPDQMGTFAWWKYWQYVRFYNDGTGINRHGFTQNGIDVEFPKLELFCSRIGIPIINVCAWSQSGVDRLVERTNDLNCVAVEVNCNCGNVDYISPDLAYRLIDRYVTRSVYPVMAKIGLGHNNDLASAMEELVLRAKLLKDTVAALNLINSVAVELALPDWNPPFKGMVSGPPILPFGLEATERVAQTRWYEGRLMAGGGISNVRDGAEYLKRGADALKVGIGLHRDHLLLDKLESLVIAEDKWRNRKDRTPLDLERLLGTHSARQRTISSDAEMLRFPGD